MVGGASLQNAEGDNEGGENNGSQGQEEHLRVLRRVECMSPDFIR